MRLRFVTTNPGKLREAQARLQPLGFNVVPYRAQVDEIQADTLEEVARHKAKALLTSVPSPYFLEDAGLFVDALNGFPGVYSRPAFETIGCGGILKLLEGVPARRRGARFRAVVAYVGPHRRIRLFAGEAPGSIVARPRGRHGFGFDPIFDSGDRGRTFAELTPTQKGFLSHRGRALDALTRALARESTTNYKGRTTVRNPARP